MVGSNGKMNMIIGVMFAHRLKGGRKLLVPKFGNLQKHVEKHKCKCVRPKYNMGQCYMSMKSQHTK